MKLLTYISIFVLWISFYGGLLSTWSSISSFFKEEPKYGYFCIAKIENTDAFALKFIENCEDKSVMFVATRVDVK